MWVQVSMWQWRLKREDSHYEAEETDKLINDLKHAMQGGKFLLDINLWSVFSFSIDCLAHWLHTLHTHVHLIILPFSSLFTLDNPSYEPSFFLYLDSHSLPSFTYAHNNLYITTSTFTTSSTFYFSLTLIFFQTISTNFLTFNSFIAKW